MPPKGWRKKKGITPQWNKSFTPFGDRVNFLSPERQHLATGTLRILPPKEPERRERNVGE